MSYATRYEERSQNAHRFSMWLAIVSSCMVFAGFTSAFLVRRGAGGNWAGFDIATVFSLSTFIIIFSSAMMIVAHIANKKGNLSMTTLGLGITLLCGLLFCIFQYNGWVKLVNQGFYPSGNPNPAPQFLFVIVIVHALHVLSGLVFMAIAFGRSLKLLKQKDILEQYNSDKILLIRTDLLGMYWHFMGILWLYLFGFLYFFLK